MPFSLLSRRTRLRSFAASGLTLAAILTPLGGCGILPSAGPSTDDVTERFTPKDNPLGVQLVALSPQTVSTVGSTPRSTLREIGSLHGGLPIDRIGPGDTLSITIYETGPGLFSAAHVSPSSGDAGTPSGSGSGNTAASTGTTAETLPRLQVNRAGQITVPYVGQITVAGHTTTEVQQMIQNRLAGKASQPQVVVGVLSNDTNVVFVSGDVKSSGRFPLTLSGESILDAVALAGGPAKPAQDMQIRLTRHGRMADASLSDVQDIPAENVAVEPQDRIQVVYEPRTFLVFGATGKVAQVPFDQTHVNLAEAVARSGGLDDQRANPESVFLFRFEPANIGHALGVPVPAGMDTVPVIYHVNMRDPQTFFLLQRFAMRDKDLIYVANAPTVQLYKFLQIINSVFTPVVYSRAAAGN